jgi:SAM-dependent methyltransferase
MTSYPRGFVPDLRRLRPWPSLRDSLWRNPELVALTYGAVARLVVTAVGRRPATVLDVGCGMGHVALELARAGHDVTGVDADHESVSLAIRAAESDPTRRRRGPLSYQVADFPESFEDRGPYDRVLFSRVLHHIDDPAAAVARAAELLHPHGRVVIVDFAHDRLGPAGARWIARSRMRLARSGWWPDRVAESIREETAAVSRQWRADHEDEGLNPFGAMVGPLRRRFALQVPVWHPYLFWDLAAEMQVPRHREAAVARDLRDQEAVLLRHRRLRGVLFSTTGQGTGADATRGSRP